MRCIRTCYTCALVDIRQIKESDSAPIRDFLQSFWDTDCDTVIHWSGSVDFEQESARLANRCSELAAVFIAAEKEKVLGVLEAGIPNAEELLHTCGFRMFVLEKARGRGIGYELVRALISWAETKNVHLIELEVFFDNTPAISLYRKHRFIEDGRIQNKFKLRNGTYCDSIHMAMYL